MESWLKYTEEEIDYITDDKLRFLLDNNTGGGPSSVLGNRHVKWEEK